MVLFPIEPAATQPLMQLNAFFPYEGNEIYTQI